MPAFTVDELVRRAKSKADMHDDFIQSQEWLDRFNNANLQFERMRIGRGYISNNITENITITGALQYPISDPLAILAIFEFDTARFRYIPFADPIYGGLRRGVADLGPAKEARVYQNTAGITTVEFWPIPQVGNNYGVIVVEQPTRKTLFTDTVNIPNGWEDWIVCHMAIDAMAKEESENPALEKIMARVESFVEESVFERMFAGARVRNVDKQERGWTKEPFIPDASRWMRF
jgi:hypothetical protein